MRRITAIRHILKNVSNEVVITSCGMISREAYKVKDRPRNFYIMGAMGSELGVGIGLAYTRPDLKVIVISGDGSALMGASTILLSKTLDLDNIWHYILDNECYASTGGQKTCPITGMSDWMNNTFMWKVTKEKGTAPRIPLTPVQITERFRNAISPNSS